MAKKSQQQLHGFLVGLLKTYRADEIQKALGDIYIAYSDGSRSEWDQHYWLKCSRASYNLSSGMNKWLYEDE